MEDRYLATLEYVKITHQLATHTAFRRRARWHGAAPSADPEEVRLRLQETTEAKALLSSARTSASVGRGMCAPDAPRVEVCSSPRALEIRVTPSARETCAQCCPLGGRVPLLAARAEGWSRSPR